MLTQYNTLHGTDYDRLEALEGKEDRDADVVAFSAGGFPEVRFQVTKADQLSWASLARSASYQASVTQDDLLQVIWNAIDNKRNRLDPEIVLVLDGWGVIKLPGTIDLFVQRYAEKLKTVGFRETWWSDHTVGGVVRRLA